MRSCCFCLYVPADCSFPSYRSLRGRARHDLLKNRCFGEALRRAGLWLMMTQGLLLRTCFQVQRFVEILQIVL